MQLFHGPHSRNVETFYRVESEACHRMLRLSRLYEQQDYFNISKLVKLRGLSFGLTFTKASLCLLGGEYTAVLYRFCTVRFDARTPLQNHINYVSLRVVLLMCLNLYFCEQVDEVQFKGTQISRVGVQ